MPKKTQIRTVADELANRNRCRFGLRGVRVKVGRSGFEQVIESSDWNAAGTLVVTLGNGQRFPPHLLYLRSVWPPACCKPKVRHRWNTPRTKPAPR